MAVSDNYVPIKYDGTGSIFDFSASFQVLNATNAQVWLEDANGFQTLQTLGVDYTITLLNEGASGYIATFLIAPAADEKVVLARDIPYNRNTDYTTSSGFPADTVDADVDKTVLLIQQVREEIDRTLATRIGTNIDGTLPEPVAGLSLGWNATEDGIVNLVASTQNLPAVVDTYLKRNPANTGWLTKTVAELTADLDAATNALQGAIRIATDAEFATATSEVLAVNPKQVGNGAYWKKYTVPYSSFTAAANTETIELLELPAKGVIHNVVVKHSTAFSGGSLTGYNIKVGLTAETDKYSPAFDVFQAVADTTAFNNRCDFVEDFGSVTSIKITADSIGDTLDNVTAGSVDVWVFKSVLS
jgi:hypothetical protein